MSEARILIVDDDREFVEANRELLEAEGFTVDVAYDGASGLTSAKQNHPDLIVLDVMMATDTEGFDISRKIVKEPSLEGIPVILLTGIRKAMNLPFAFEPDEAWLPVRTVLEKPVPPEQFLNTIKEHLAAS